MKILGRSRVQEPSGGVRMGMSTCSHGCRWQRRVEAGEWWGGKGQAPRQASSREDGEFFSATILRYVTIDGDVSEGHNEGVCQVNNTRSGRRLDRSLQGLLCVLIPRIRRSA